MDKINKNKYKVTVQYDGSCFHGWAKQPNVRTVQQEIENNLKKLYGKEILIDGSGRTDAYVHAEGQVFSFQEKGLTLKKGILLKALNAMTSEDVEYLKVEKVKNNFNARYCAKNKTYRYDINTKKKNIFKEKYFLNYCQKIDLKKIKAVAQLLVGDHDFLSFSTTTVEDTKRKINWIRISQKNGIVTVKINGNGFLRNMVRMIVGSFLDINENKKTIEDIEMLLKNPKKGSSIRKAPGCGLYLEKVYY